MQAHARGNSSMFCFFHHFLLFFLYDPNRAGATTVSLLHAVVPGPLCSTRCDQHSRTCHYYCAPLYHFVELNFPSRYHVVNKRCSTLRLTESSGKWGCATVQAKYLSTSYLGGRLLTSREGKRGAFFVCYTAVTGGNGHESRVAGCFLNITAIKKGVHTIGL